MAKSNRIKLLELLKRHKACPTDIIKDQVTSKKATVERLLREHYRGLRAIAPRLAEYDLTPGVAHDDPICLPSTFNAQERAEYELEELARLETALRIGQCHDDLVALRRALSVRSHLTRHSRQPLGYGTATRVQDTIQRAARTVTSLAQTYRRHYNGLISLGTSQATSQGLRPLEAADLILLSDWIEDRGFRSGQKISLPWIWTLTENQWAEHEEHEVGEVDRAIAQWNAEGKTEWLPK